MSSIANAGDPGGQIVRSRETMVTYVTQVIRERLISGAEAAGSRLNQREIAENLGVSLIPLREALRALEAEGLVRIVPHRGAFVAALSTDEVWEIFRIREQLDPLATESAVSRLTSADLAHLKELIDEMEIATAERNYDVLTAGNREFHSYIYKAANMPILYQLIMTLRDRYSSYSRMCIELPGYARRSQDDHVAIYEACAAERASEAGRLMEQHLRVAANALAAHLEGHWRHEEGRGPNDER